MTLKMISALLIVLISLSVTAQKDTPNLPIDSLTKKITYSEVVFVDSNINKQELFSRAREWFAKVYKSSTNVIQMEDKENGKIVGKALMQVYCKSLGADRKCGFVNYTISFYLKDGRYKFEITDFYHSGQQVSIDNIIPDYGPCEYWIDDKRKYPMMSQKGVQKISNYFLKQIDSNINYLIIDFKQAMKTKSSGNDNW